MTDARPSSRGAGGAWVDRWFDVAELFSAAPDGRGPVAVDPSDVAVMIPTSGTTGRSKLVMQTHLAYVMAGEGFPYWMRLTADDRLDDVAAALPHQRARVLDARIARGAREPRPAAGASRPAPSSTPPAGTARPSSTRSGRCSRSSCASPSGPTTPTTRCASATPARRPSASASEEIERRFGLELVCGYALSESPVRARSGATATPAVRLARLGAASTRARARERRARARRRRRAVRGRRDRRARAAQPGDHARLLRDAGGDRRGDARRVAAHRRPRDRQRRRHLHVRRAQEGGDPPAGREPLAGGGRGRARAASRRRRGRGHRRCRRTCRRKR